MFLRSLMEFWSIKFWNLVKYRAILQLDLYLIWFYGRKKSFKFILHKYIKYQHSWSWESRRGRDTTPQSHSLVSFSSWQGWNWRYSDLLHKLALGPLYNTRQHPRYLADRFRTITKILERIFFLKITSLTFITSNHSI